MNTDHRLLIAPPPLPKLDDQTEVSDIMRNILMELPVDKNNKCLQYYTSDALNTTEEYHMKVNFFSSVTCNTLEFIFSFLQKYSFNNHS